MKTKFFFLSLLLCSTLSFSQTVIRVKSGEKIQNIIDNVNTPAGSILLLDPGNYDGFIVLKRVSIIGSGFFNGNNTSTITDDLTFGKNANNSSDNSLIMGCNVSRINVNTDNISIIRCRAFTGTNGIIIGASNCKIIQSFVDNNIDFNQLASNFKITNCIVLGAISTSVLTQTITGKITFNTVGANQTNCVGVSFSGNFNKPIDISNNIFLSTINCNNDNGGQNYRTDFYAKFNNNIVRKGNYQSTDVSNKFLTDMTTLFTNTGTSPDSKYLLSATSPAKGAGEGGTDCGAFGGTEPYIIGGTPLGPIIEDLQVPSTARQNEVIKIKLKAKVQN